MQFPATLHLAGQRAPFQQPNRKYFFDCNYPFQAISSNFGFNWKKRLPQQLNMEFILNWIYPFQAISSKCAFSWQKSTPSSSQTETFLLDWNYPFQAISSNLRFSQQKSPLPPVTEQGKNLDWIYPFQAISSNFGLSWQLSSPRGQTGKNFRWYLFFSGNFQQLWVQLAVKPPSRKAEIFYSGSIHFMQFPATLPLFGRKIPNSGTKWNFLQTKFIHFRQFSATLGSAGS